MVSFPPHPQLVCLNQDPDTVHTFHLVLPLSLTCHLLEDSGSLVLLKVWILLTESPCWHLTCLSSSSISCELVARSKTSLLWTEAEGKGEGGRGPLFAQHLLYARRCVGSLQKWPYVILTTTLWGEYSSSLFDRWRDWDSYGEVKQPTQVHKARNYRNRDWNLALSDSKAPSLSTVPGTWVAVLEREPSCLDSGTTSVSIIDIAIYIHHKILNDQCCIIIPILQWRNWGPERVNDLPWALQLVSRAKIHLPGLSDGRDHVLPHCPT